MYELAQWTVHGGLYTETGLCGVPVVGARVAADTAQWRQGFQVTDFPTTSLPCPPSSLEHQGFSTFLKPTTKDSSILM